MTHFLQFTVLLLLLLLLLKFTFLTAKVDTFSTVHGVVVVVVVVVEVYISNSES